MSSFICEKCGIKNLDSPQGYIAGCHHYPPEFDGMIFIRSEFSEFKPYNVVNGKIMQFYSEWSKKP